MRLKTFMVILILSLQIGCTVKPKYLVEQEYKEEPKQEIQERKKDWNWKNRHRLRVEKREKSKKE